MIAEQRIFFLTVRSLLPTVRKGHLNIAEYVVDLDPVAVLARNQGVYLERKSEHAGSGL